MKYLALSYLTTGLLLFSTFSYAADRYWIASSPSNWNNTANWSIASGGTGGASVPGSSDAVIFDANGVGNCTLDIAISVSSFSVLSGYTGTIVHGINSITIASAASFAGGMFSGGSASITVSGGFTLSGSTFTSTSGTLEFRGLVAFTSGVFAHNNGSVRYNPTNTITPTLSGVSPVFYNLEFVGLSRSFALTSSGAIDVLNTLTLSGSSLFYNLNTGTINVKGDINITNNDLRCGGDATVIINGTGTQNFNGAATAAVGALPKLTINKPSGVLNLFGYPSVSNDFTYVAGTILAGTSTFCFTHSSNSYSISGSVSFENILFFANSSGLTATIASGSLTANGNLLISGTGFLVLNTGNIDVKGNLILTNTSSAGGGSATITLNGTTNQTIDGTGITSGQSRLPGIVINKASGTLFLAGNISFASNVTLSSGTVDAGTSVAYLVNGLTLTGNLLFFDLTISSSITVNITVASGNTTTVLNKFTLDGSAVIGINTGTVAVRGDVYINNTSTGGGGTGTVLLNGAGSQTIYSTVVANQGRLPAVTINKTGSLTVQGIITVVGSWTYTSGTLVTNGATIAFNNNLSITGTHSLNNVEFIGGGNYVYTITPGTVLTINGTMSISGSNNVSLNTGNINLLGDLVLTNTGLAGGGTTIVSLSGTGNQSILTPTILLINQSRLPAITINKVSGTLTFPALITVRGNWTYTTGTMDVTTNASNVVFANSLTISGNHTFQNITFEGSGNYTISLAGTTLTINGNMSMSGTSAFPNNNIALNGGVINLTGNLLLSNTGASGGGTTVLNFNSSSNQNIISSLTINQNNLPAVTINKPGGTLTFPSVITVRGNWTYMAGSLDLSTNNSTVAFNNILQFTGTHTLNNVTLQGNTNNTYTVNTGTVLTVAGVLAITGTSNVGINTPVSNTTAIQAQGNISITNTSVASGGTGMILINGSVDQTLSSTSSAGQGRLPFVRIQKPSGTLFITGTVSGSRDWTYASGTVDPGTSTVVFGGNNLTVTGSGMNFNNVSINSNTTTLNSSLMAKGNISISGTGVFSAVGNTISVGGNWTNYGTAGFTEGTSTVQFTGGALQTLTTTGGETFTNLTINNTNSGIQLGSNVVVSAALNMMQGNVDLNGSALTVGTSTANRGSVSRTTGTMFGSGSITRWFNAATIATGSTSGLFPVGTNTDYRPLYISAPILGPTTGGTVTVSYSNATSVTDVAFLDNLIWVLKRKDASWTMSTGNGFTGGLFNLRIDPAGIGTLQDVNDLRIIRANDVIGSPGINAGVTAFPEVNRTLLGSSDLNNSFYVGSINAASTLPVTLISFDVHAVNGGVEILWKTALEINNDHFTIERTQDAQVFEPVAIVFPKTANASVRSYSYLDANPLPGRSYYRLKQSDFDGKVTYTDVKRIDLVNRETQIDVYPNPGTRNELWLQLKGIQKNEPVTITFRSEVAQLDVIVLQDHENVIDLSKYISLSVGIYFVVVQTAGVREVKKIVIF